jgi:hydrogenase maturation factor
MSDRCADARCVTCADEAVTMQVVHVTPDAVVRCRNADGTVADVMTDLVGAVRPGEKLLVHAGVALARVEAEAG